MSHVQIVESVVYFFFSLLFSLSHQEQVSFTDAQVLFLKTSVHPEAPQQLVKQLMP